MKIVLQFLPESVDGGASARKAKEKMANASCIAGMAFANAFLGICHSLAHKLGGKFHVPHGIANALLLEEVIRFNAEDAPTKMGVFPQYRYPDAINRYAKAADFLGLTKPGQSREEKVEEFIKALNELKDKIGIPRSIREWGVPEKDFLEAVDELAVDAFDDQCTPANPRYPLISELKEIYLKSYYGKEWENEKERVAQILGF